jgi:hypothetical protein
VSILLELTVRDLIPSRYPSNTWRGFGVRVATIAIAALVVLGAADLFEYLQTPTPTHSFEPDSHATAPSSPQDTP